MVTIDQSLGAVDATWRHSGRSEQRTLRRRSPAFRHPALHPREHQPVHRHAHDDNDDEDAHHEPGGVGLPSGVEEVAQTCAPKQQLRREQTIAMRTTSPASIPGRSTEPSPGSRRACIAATRCRRTSGPRAVAGAGCFARPPAPRPRSTRPTPSIPRAPPRPHSPQTRARRAGTRSRSAATGAQARGSRLFRRPSARFP